jgi:hypothetical protein
MNIEKILLIIIIIYLIISHSKKNNKEHFAVTDDIRAAIKEIYNTDMEAIRKLDKIADDLTKGALTIPGNLSIPGNLTIGGSINTTGSIVSKGEIKTLNTDNTDKASLNTVNTNTNSNSTSISSLSSSLSSVNTSISTLSNNIKEFDNEYIWGTNSVGGIYRCKAPCNGNWEKIGTGALGAITQSKKYIWGTLCIEKAKLFLFATTTLKNKTTFYFLTVAMVVILINV